MAIASRMIPRINQSIAVTSFLGPTLIPGANELRTGGC
jgi:hypothetical protein